MPSIPAIRNSLAKADDEFTAFYLTDYLARHFDKLIWAGLGLDRHPELLSSYFGNYTKVIYLAQTHDEQLVENGQEGGRSGWASPMNIASPATANWRPIWPRAQLHWPNL